MTSAALLKSFEEMCENEVMLVIRVVWIGVRVRVGVRVSSEVDQEDAG